MNGERSILQKVLRLAFLMTMVGFLGAGIFFLKDYPIQKPVTVGPLKQAFLWVLFSLLLVESFLIWGGVGRKQLFASGCFFSGALFFSVRPVFGWLFPESSVLSFFDRFFPLGLFFLLCGVVSALPRFGVKPLSEKGRLFLGLAVLLVALSPIFSTGYAWDDSFFTSEIPAMRVRGESIFSRMFGEIIEYGKMGRLNPFATFHFLVFYLIPNPFLYKCFLVLLTVCSAGLFYRFVKQYSGDSALGLSSLIVLPLCFQLRLYNDPLTGYYGLMQVMFCELMLSLSCFLAFLRKKRKRDLFLSLLFFLFMLTSYEMAFPLTALYILLAWDEEKNLFYGVKRAFPHIVLAVCLFAVSMLLRSRNITEETVYSGTTFALKPSEIFRTLWYQISGALPLSYQLAGNDAFLLGYRFAASELFPTDFFGFVKGIRLEDMLAVAVVWLISFAPLPVKTKKAERGFFLKIIVFSLALLILPGLVISLSEKYQRDLVAGLAYIPVFFSCFGSALLIGCLIRRLSDKKSDVLRGICFGAFFVSFLLNQQNNRRVADRINAVFLYPRTVGEDALRMGLLGENDDLKQVLSARSYSLWEMGWQREPYQTAFYTANSGKMVQTFSVEDFVRSLSAQKTEQLIYYPEASRIVDYDGNREYGFAKSARIRETKVDFEQMALSDTLVTDILVYLKGYSDEDPWIVYQTREGTEHQVHLSDAWLIRQTDAGKLVKIQENEVVRFDSVGVMLYR